MWIKPLLVAIAGWLLPGAGHALLGRLDRAVWFGSLILGMFALGVVLGEGASVSAARFPYHYYGQLGAALPAVVVDRIWGLAPQGRTIDRLELGLVFTTVAGIMNLVAVVDAFELSRRDERRA